MNVAILLTFPKIARRRRSEGSSRLVKVVIFSFSFQEARWKTSNTTCSRWWCPLGENRSRHTDTVCCYAQRITVRWKRTVSKLLLSSFLAEQFKVKDVTPELYHASSLQHRPTNFHKRKSSSLAVSQAQLHRDIVLSILTQFAPQFDVVMQVLLEYRSTHLLKFEHKFESRVLHPQKVQKNLFFGGGKNAYFPNFLWVGLISIFRIGLFFLVYLPVRKVMTFFKIFEVSIRIAPPWAHDVSDRALMQSISKMPSGRDFKTMPLVSKTDAWELDSSNGWSIAH